MQNMIVLLIVFFLSIAYATHTHTLSLQKRKAKYGLTIILIPFYILGGCSGKAGTCSSKLIAVT